MRHSIDSLRCNITRFEGNHFCPPVESVLRDTESVLQSIVSQQSIEGDLVSTLDELMVILKEKIQRLPVPFMEKTRALGLIEKVQSRLKVTILNPNGRVFSSYTREKILSLKKYGYVGSVIITSTERSVEEQARIMYENILKKGKAEQLRTYLQPGQNVINIYDESLSREKNIAAMAEQIRKEGPEHVSKHIANSEIINVIDVDRKTLSNVQTFVDAARHAGFTKILDENGCIHLELPQP